MTLRFRAGEADDRAEMTALPTELTKLADDESNPHTPRMDPADLESMSTAEQRRVTVAHEGPAPLPPPPTGQPLVTNPAIPLPPPPPLTDPFLNAPPADAGTRSTEVPRPTRASGLIHDDDEFPTLSQKRRESPEPPTRQPRCRRRRARIRLPSRRCGRWRCRRARATCGAPACSYARCGTGRRGQSWSWIWPGPRRPGRCSGWRCCWAGSAACPSGRPGGGGRDDLLTRARRVAALLILAPRRR